MTGVKTSAPVDWGDEESYLLLNPRLPQADRGRMGEIVAAFVAENARLKGHVFLATSGTTAGQDETKLVALSKRAILASAETVNRAFGIVSSDRWFRVLPEHHIGGLSISARASLSASVVADVVFPQDKWHPDFFLEKIADERCTLGSLVPTQIHDLVRAELRPPPSLRLVFVGGGALSDELHGRARELGWPVLPTYGCSEAASQIATGSPEMEVLPHLRVRLVEGKIAVSGPSLFSGYLFLKDRSARFHDPKQGGWFLSDDRGELRRGRLKCLGRDFSFAKVNGESVDLNRLHNIFASLAAQPADFALIGFPDERSGQTVALVSPAAPSLQAAIDLFNSRVLPFERIRKTFTMAIPRTDLGKIRHAQLLASLSIAR